ncbi:hypothetical protein KDX16_15020 [Burkholderia vietnamiensis]|uniref:hypothetical protein n=1 Tax=Burkholderia vietnamiensis TaxID=60552 RepID=UPI0012D8E768|nr:hypothetical protein [Burkholderia vietnamiensis]MBR7917138.1 hypothetical protein [Burkholderia vietnamiensis]HDR8968087.1 hypothetical protein [Burkholderia vietnamiensis]
MNAPTNGADRYVNADEFFGVGEHFFLVEFKSSKGSLKTEARKSSACKLCGRLNESTDARELHDAGHFASWGNKTYNGPLRTSIGVYRKLVCRSDVLTTCEHTTSTPGEWDAVSGDDFLENLERADIGLDAERFKVYLRWLLESPPDSGSPPEFPLVLFGYTYSKGVLDQEFSSYADFSNWAAEAVKYSATISGAKKNRP